MIVSFVNVKGGVGKTTTAVNLAAVLAAEGLDVLLVDLDPQGSATYSLVGDVEGPSLADALLDDRPVAEVLYETGRERLDLIPGDLRLADAYAELSGRRSPEKRLSATLSPIRRQYDLILVDAPPGLSLLPKMALYASSGYVVPTHAQELSLRALSRFFEGIERLKSELRRATQLVGIVLTMVDRRTQVTAELIAQLRREYGSRVFKTEIPINVRLAEAPRWAGSILDYESWSSGGRAYRELGGELLRRLRSQGLL